MTGPLEDRDLPAALGQRLEIAPFVLVAFAREQLRRRVVALGRGAQALRDLAVQLRQVDALEVIGEVRRCVDEAPVNLLHVYLLRPFAASRTHSITPMCQHYVILGRGRSAVAWGRLLTARRGASCYPRTHDDCTTTVSDRRGRAARAGAARD